MSKSRIIVNADYVHEHAATYQELREWINSLPRNLFDTPVLMGMPDGKVYAIRKPVETSTEFFQGEAIEVETAEADDAISEHFGGLA